MNIIQDKRARMTSSTAKKIRVRHRQRASISLASSSASVLSI